MLKVIKRVLRLSGDLSKRIYASFVFSFIDSIMAMFPVGAVFYTLTKIQNNKAFAGNDWLVLFGILIISLVVRMVFKYLVYSFQSTAGFEFVSRERITLNSVYTRSGQNSTPNSNATNLHSSQKRCCSFCISSSNASPTFQVQKSIFHQMTKPIQVTVILPLLLAISFSRNDDIHSSISGISNDLIGVIPTIGQ